MHRGHATACLACNPLIPSACRIRFGQLEDALCQCTRMASTAGNQSRLALALGRIGKSVTLRDGIAPRPRLHPQISPSLSRFAVYVLPTSHDQDAFWQSLNRASRQSSRTALHKIPFFIGSKYMPACFVDHGNLLHDLGMQIGNIDYWTLWHSAYPCALQ